MWMNNLISVISVAVPFIDQTCGSYAISKLSFGFPAVGTQPLRVLTLHILITIASIPICSSCSFQDHGGAESPEGADEWIQEFPHSSLSVLLHPALNSQPSF